MKGAVIAGISVFLALSVPTTTYQFLEATTFSARGCSFTAPAQGSCAWKPVYLTSWAPGHCLSIYSFHLLCTGVGLRAVGIGFCPQSFFSKKRQFYPEKIRYAGRLCLKVQPPDVEVLVDGYSIPCKGISRFDLALLTGKYVIQVEKEGYEPYSREVEIQQGTRTRVNVVLRKLSGGAP